MWPIQTIKNIHYILQTNQFKITSSIYIYRLNQNRIMVKNESSCLNFKLVNIFVILMFLICSSIFYGIYYVFSIVSNVNAMSVAFPALRAIVEQVPERLVVLDKNGNYNGQIVLI